MPSLANTNNAIMEPISHLVILGTLNTSVLSKVKLRFPSSKIIYWTKDYNNTSIKILSNISHDIIVDDALVDPFQQITGKPVTPLTKVIPISAFELNVYRISDTDQKDVLSVNNGPILFIPLNDTHVKHFELISKHLDNVAFLGVDHGEVEFNIGMMDELNIPYFTDPKEIDSLSPSAIVVANDWAPFLWPLFLNAHRKQIPTVCIQEGPLDFDLGCRMEQTFYVFVQGPITLKYLKRDHYFLAGNPKHDLISKTTMPKNPMILINCNFTYDMYEEHRDQWINDIVSICDQLNIPYFISHHPRDQGQYKNSVRSRVDSVVDQLNKATLVISRFSSIIIEAIQTHTPTIYYNPHGETERIYTEDTSGGLLKATSKLELAVHIKNCSSPVSTGYIDKMETFLDWNIGERDGKSSYYCASYLASISNISSSI